MLVKQEKTAPIILKVSIFYSKQQSFLKILFMVLFNKKLLKSYKSYKKL